MARRGLGAGEGNGNLGSRGPGMGKCILNVKRLVARAMHPSMTCAAVVPRKGTTCQFVVR